MTSAGWAGWLVVIGVAGAATAGPYEPPPFTRFPDEPTDLPPPRSYAEVDDPWMILVHAFRGTSLHAIVGADAPLALGGGLELWLPWRIRFGATVGELPKAVLHAANDELVDHGVYERALGDLVIASLARVVRWRTYVALHPFATHGLLVSAGYSAAIVDGSATAYQVASASGMPLPAGLPLDLIHLELHSQLRMVDAALGWEWQFLGRWSVRIDLGGAFTRAARVRVRVASPLVDDRIGELAERAASTLHHAYTSYVRTPTVSTFLGFHL